jgi:moderate conductance mechanosensitive channel
VTTTTFALTRAALAPMSLAAHPAGHAVAADPSPAPSPVVSPPSCRQASEICQFVWDQTGQRWLAESSYYLLIKPLTIVIVVIGALIIRFLVHRMINRLARGAGDSAGPSLLRPLRERLPVPLQEAAGIRNERRRQRAEALGSVLRSVASVTVFTIAVLLVLGEIGFELAPLLASAGVAGVAIGFGAQNLVKDFIAGLFMLLEDQYGVGDLVDLGEANGTVEAVGLRITTIRDARGVVWYIRNGEIVRVGNKSQGWALVVVDVPVGFAGVEEATGVLRTAATAMATDPAYAEDLIEPPQVLGVEQITVDGAVVRTTAKTASDRQWRVGRELRRRLTEALESAGIAQQIGGGRIFVRPSAQDPGRLPTDPGVDPGGPPTDSGVGGPI